MAVSTDYLVLGTGILTIDNVQSLYNFTGSVPSTYYPRSNPSGFISSSNFVSQTGSQNISGLKTFFEPIAVWKINDTGVNSGVTALNASSRSLYDSSENISVSFGARELYDSVTVKAITWENRGLYDSTNSESLNWTSRYLFDSSGSNSLHWQNRRLIEIGDQATLDWQNRNLFGNWSIDTPPSQTGHLVHKLYVDTSLSGFVSTSGDQTISGLKTFTSIENPTLILASGSLNGYSEINLKNSNTGRLASADLVVTSNNGDADNFYTDIGINSSNYTGGFVGSTGDSYLYSKSNDLYIGNVVTGRNIYLFAGSAPSGTDKVTVTISSTGLAVTGNINIKVSDIEPVPLLNDFNIFSNYNAGRPMLETKHSLSTQTIVYQPAFFNTNYLCYFPSNNNSISQFGNAAFTGGGTFTTPLLLSDLTMGLQGQFSTTTASGSAGICATGAAYMRSNTGIYSDGFFFYTRFCMPSGSGNYFAGTSGHRFFVGMTTQNLINSSFGDIPTGDYIGFMHRNTNTAPSSGFYIFTSRSNNSGHLENTTIPFSGSGVFDAYLYCPRYPSGDKIFWRLDDVTRRLSQTGSFANLDILPRYNQLMRPMLSLTSLAAPQKSVRFQKMYLETER